VQRCHYRVPEGRATRPPEADHSLAPDFTLVSTSGERIHLRDLQGHPVILFFFATWGRICRTQLTVLAELARSGMAVLGISTEDADTLARFSEEYDAPFPLLSDPDGLIKERYHITCLPTATCVCSRGTIIVCHRGDVDLEGLSGRLLLQA
jgi:peroxiredoxin